MIEVVMHTAEPVSTRESTERLAKILDIIYAKADLEHVATESTQLNSEERNKLLSLIRDFEDLFDGTLVNWDTDPVELELNPDSKMFNCKYYLVRRTNKKTFLKELKRLVKIEVLNMVQQSQYGTPVFIISKKEGTVRFIIY